MIEKLATMTMMLKTEGDGSDIPVVLDMTF